MATVKFLLEKAEKLFKREYNEKKRSSMDDTNYYFQNEKLLLEPPHSSFYPTMSFQGIEDLDPIDKQVVINILRTAAISKFELPEFDCLVNKDTSNEYSFELWFRFG